MYLFRRLALLPALCLAASTVLLAQSSSSNVVAEKLIAESSSSSAMPDSVDAQDPAQASQDPAQTPAGQNQGPVTVQGRIRALLEQRRSQAIHDAYSHAWETYVGMGYLRFAPGPHLQHVTYYSWDAELTRFYSERLGVTVGGRGYYGSPFTYVNFSSITRPAISTYMVMGGPVYRFYLQPKYSISGRVMGGWALGNFSGDTNKFGGPALGLWPDGSTYAINGDLTGEYNIGPGLSLRLAGEYVATGFGSTMQNSFGFTGGIVYRFGKQ
jgi:hypothetical protein